MIECESASSMLKKLIQRVQSNSAKSAICYLIHSSHSFSSETKAKFAAARVKRGA